MRRCSSCAARFCFTPSMARRRWLRPWPLPPPRKWRRCRIAGAKSIVNFLVVIGFPQRIGVAGAAHECHFLRRQGAGGRGQACLQTLEAGRLGGEIDFQLRLARQRAHRGGDGPFERLGRRFRFRHGGFPCSTGSPHTRGCWSIVIPQPDGVALAAAWATLRAGTLSLPALADAPHATSTLAALSGNSSPKARW